MESFRLVQQRLRTVRTVVEKLNKGEITPNQSFHIILRDIKAAVDQLVKKTAEPKRLHE